MHHCIANELEIFTFLTSILNLDEELQFVQVLENRNTDVMASLHWLLPLALNSEPELMKKF